MLALFQEHLVDHLAGEGIEVILPFTGSEGFQRPVKIIDEMITAAKDSALVIAMVTDRSSSTILFGLGAALAFDTPLVIFYEEKHAYRDIEDLKYFRQVEIPALGTLSDIRNGLRLLLRKTLHLLEETAAEPEGNSTGSAALIEQT